MTIHTDTLSITPEMLALISEIDEFKGAWRAVGTLAPERLDGLRRVAAVESIGSSARLEGGRLSDREVERLLADRSIHASASRVEQEVFGYAQTLETVFRSWAEIAVTEGRIERLHRELIRHSRDETRPPGAAAASEEHGREIAAAAAPSDAPRPMAGPLAELVAWLAEARSGGLLHPLLAIGVFAAVFLEIQPFAEGNGRLSRILTTLLLLQAGYAYAPYCSLENTIETGEESYYLALRRTQRSIRTDQPDWQPWLLFFLRSLRQQKRRLAAAIEREQALLAALPALALKIVDQARQHGRVTMGEMLRLTGASRNTLKEHFRNLVERRYLARHGNGKGSWYGLA